MAESPTDQMVNPTDQMLKWFSYDHLPAHLQEISCHCAQLAQTMAMHLPPSAELTAGLRKLLEAKDCFVRARVEKEQF